MQHKQNILEELKIHPKLIEASGGERSSIYKGTMADIHYSLAECKIYLGQLDEALTEINTAVDLIPDLPELHKESYFNFKGHIYLIKDKYQLAIDEFNNSIEQNRSFALAYVNRAIAKVSLAENVKLHKLSIQSNLINQPMSVSWDLPNKSALKKSEYNILQALSDCDKAVEIDNKLGFAYYIRGQIKQMLMRSDYCMDLLTAKELGLRVEAALLMNCKK